MKFGRGSDSGLQGVEPRSSRIRLSSFSSIASTSIAYQGSRLPDYQPETDVLVGRLSGWRWPAPHLTGEVSDRRNDSQESEEQPAALSIYVC
jgi:hypothetical protein